MKRFSLVILFIAGTITLKAQTPADEQQAITLLRNFYTAYMTKMASTADNNEKALAAIEKKYCTAHLLQAIAKRNNPEKVNWLDYDPFLNAQDTDPAWVKTLSYKRNPKQPDLYTVSYYYYDPDNKKKVTVIIHVFVTKQKDGLKISSLYLGDNGSYKERI